MTEFVDPYLDPQTGLLRNLVGARTKEELDKVEGDLVFTRLVPLMEQPVAATGDLRELRAIHKHLFQDVYEWAGQLRTVDIRKNVEGAQYFLPFSMIERAAGYAAGELAQESGLRGLGRKQFVDRLAYHYDQVNYVHPFREGNGRVQRVFWDRVARGAGWTLDWEDVRGEVNDLASRAASDQQDFKPLKQMFAAMVTPLVDDPETAGERAARIARLAFPAPAREAVATGPTAPDLDASSTPPAHAHVRTQRREVER
ncbi:Fic family protein [Oerskovia sp. Root22]|uniref:Fic/DOC family protein n=1 Tax=Oerskovia sp. Root22 TaxID=1736494 RepID=UPI001910AA88|nr:Fic family protein [Oerskovia sp. Root22]